MNDSGAAIRESLQAVLTYNWHTEHADYSRQDAEGRERHIFPHLLRLADYFGLHTTHTSD